MSFKNKTRSVSITTGDRVATFVFPTDEAQIADWSPCEK